MKYSDKILQDVRSQLPTMSAVPIEELSMPPIGEILANLAKSVDEIVSGNNKPSSQEEAVRRLDICYTCEFYKQDNKRCTKCGCYLAVKVAWANEKCPVGNW